MVTLEDMANMMTATEAVEFLEKETEGAEQSEKMSAVVTMVLDDMGKDRDRDSGKSILDREKMVGEWLGDEEVRADNLRKLTMIFITLPDLAAGRTISSKEAFAVAEAGAYGILDFTGVIVMSQLLMMAERDA